MSKIGTLVHRVVDLYKRQDHIKYARSLGVSVGENSRFVDNPSWGSEPYLITIGKHVLISGRVTFLNHDGATWCFREEGPYKDTYKFGPIVVGDNCFIGFGATILPNVKIGDNSIIAAGSMVTKNVPAGEVWGGVPAHFITKTEDYAKKCYENRLPYDPVLMQTDAKNEMLRVLGMEKQND